MPVASESLFCTLFSGRWFRSTCCFIWSCIIVFYSTCLTLLNDLKRIFAEQAIMNAAPSNIQRTGLYCTDWQYTLILYLLFQDRMKFHTPSFLAHLPFNRFLFAPVLKSSVPESRRNRLWTSNVSDFRSVKNMAVLTMHTNILTLPTVGETSVVGGQTSFSHWQYWKSEGQEDV